MEGYNESLAFVEHLRLEHNRIHESLGKVTNAIVQAEEANEGTKSLVMNLEALRGALGRHFREEEEGGCMEEVETRCPGVARDVRVTEAAHDVIHRHLECLIENAKQIAVSAEMKVFKDHFEKFAKELHDYEARENQIVQRGLGADVMDADFESFENG